MIGGMSSSDASHKLMFNVGIGSRQNCTFEDQVMRNTDWITYSSVKQKMVSKFSLSFSKPCQEIGLILVANQSSNEVSDKTTPVDSLYVKKTLTGLHPNIMLQRSPDHFKAGSFYWSHVRRRAQSICGRMLIK